MPLCYMGNGNGKSMRDFEIGSTLPPKKACAGIYCEPGSVLDARVGIEQNTKITALVEFTFEGV